MYPMLSKDDFENYNSNQRALDLIRRWKDEIGKIQSGQESDYSIARCNYNIAELEGWLIDLDFSITWNGD